MLLPKVARARSTEPKTGCSISGGWSRPRCIQSERQSPGANPKPHRPSHWPQEVGRAGAYGVLQSHSTPQRRGRAWKEYSAELHPEHGHRLFIQDAGVSGRQGRQMWRVDKWQSSPPKMFPLKIKQLHDVSVGQIQNTFRFPLRKIPPEMLLSCLIISTLDNYRNQIHSIE